MPTTVGSLRGCKEMGLGFFNGNFQCSTMAIFRLQGNGLVVVVRGKRMAQQWGWIMAIEREFQIGVQECENGLKNRIREFKMEFRN